MPFRSPHNVSDGNAKYAFAIGQLRTMWVGGPRRKTGDLEPQSEGEICAGRKRVSAEGCGVLSLEIRGLAAAFGLAKLEW